MGTTRAELLILHVAAGLHVALGDLAHESFDEAFNLPPHGLAADELARAFLALVRRRAVQASLRTGEPVRELGLDRVRDELARWAAQTGVERARDPRALYYGLTPEGGREWEMIAQPDWDAFVDHSQGTDPDEGEISASTAEAVLAELERSRTSEVAVSPMGSGEPERLSPWSPVYWKSLPTGFRIRYAWSAPAEAFSIPLQRAWHRDVRPFLPTVR